MKNKNVGGCVLSAQTDQQKGPNAKMRKKKSKINYQTLNFFSSLVSLTLGILQNLYF